MVGSEGGEFILQMNHDNEFLSESSEQLDTEAIRLNAELDKVRRQIAEKQQRNQTLAKQLEEARSLLSKLEDGGTPGIVATTPAPAQLARQHNDQGLVLYREKRYAEALAEFTTAATLDSTNAQAANNVGYVHFKLGAYEESAKWLEKTVALDPSRAVAYPNLGDAYYKLNRREDALKAYERYLTLMPTGPAAAAVKLKLAELRP
jgi:tetratricopeptide (TPR) repeat protein